MRKKLWAKALDKEGTLGQMSENFQVYFIHINFFKKPNKKIYKFKAKQLYCDTTIFVFFILYCLLAQKKWKLKKYTLISPFTKWQSALLSAAGDLSRVSGCLAHSHYNRASLAARAFRSERQLLDAAGADRGYDIATAYPGAENFCHKPRHQSRATSVFTQKTAFG